MGVLRPWGVFSSMGGYHDKCGDILSTVGDIMINVGDILSTVGDIMINVGDILSTVGVFSTMEGYHEYCGGYLEYRGGCSVPWYSTILLAWPEDGRTNRSSASLIFQHGTMFCLGDRI